MKHFILLGIALSIISCGRISNTQQLQRMYGKEIDLSVLSRQAEILSTHKIVVFHYRNQCSNCQLGRISDWDEIIAQLDSIQPAVPVYFIIAPPKEELNAIRQKILELKLQRYRIEIDSTNRFMQQNKAIPADALFHTLLLDGQKRIVVVGSPLFNNKMWKIYCSEIKRLCEQDGKSYE